MGGVRDRSGIAMDVEGEEGVDSELRGVHLALPGEPVTIEPGFLRGHGTYQSPSGDMLTASLCGVVEHVNKLVTVKPLRSRYAGEIGDVVVGRVTEVASKRWKVDVNGRQDAVLMLSSINLPGGVLRRRTAEDALQMRQYFEEDDLISAEVQQFYQDGSMSIHTRSLKYGKLENGQFVAVPASLVKRCKSHFHVFSFGVSLVLGTNGYLWLSATPPNIDKTNEKLYQEPEVAQGYKHVDLDMRRKIARVRNVILALARSRLPISPSTIEDVYESSRPFPVTQLLEKDVMDRILESARAAARASMSMQ